MVDKIETQFVEKLNLICQNKGITNFYTID